MNFHDELDYSHTLAGEFIASFCYPWQALPVLKDFLSKIIQTLDKDYIQITEGVFVHATAQIAQSACIVPPCIIGASTQVRHGAYLRGGVLVGNGCVVGNSVELKNCVLFDGAQVPHFNYVGDSILGYRAHLGAGAITSNVRLDNRPVVVRGEKIIETGMRKLGAIVGDHAQIGCNSVLNPGTVIAKGAYVMPLSCVRGVVK